MPPAPELTYRRAGEADLAALVALVESAYRGPASLAGWTSEAELLGGQRTDPAMIAALIARAGTLVLLAERAGTGGGGGAGGASPGDDQAELLACCELRAPAEPGGPAYFGMFSVRPTLQGAGLGRVILAEAERIAREEFRASAIEMTVIRQRETLIAWYERRGYVRTGRTEPFPYGDPRFGEPKVDDLAFEVLAKRLPS